MDSQQHNLLHPRAGRDWVGEETGSTQTLSSMRSRASPVPHDQPLHLKHKGFPKSPPTFVTKISYWDHMLPCVYFSFICTWFFSPTWHQNGHSGYGYGNQVGATDSLASWRLSSFWLHSICIPWSYSRDEEIPYSFLLRVVSVSPEV